MEKLIAVAAAYNTALHTHIQLPHAGAGNLFNHCCKNFIALP